MLRWVSEHERDCAGIELVRSIFYECFLQPNYSALLLCCSRQVEIVL